MVKRALVCVAVVCLVGVAAQDATAATPARIAVGSSLRGFFPPRNGALREVGGATPVTVSVSFAPRNPQLLTRLAEAESAGRGLSTARLRALFSPAPGQLASTVSYLRGEGLRETATGLLTRTFTGSAADVEAAFGTHLVSYRRGAATVREALQVPTLPAEAALGVTAVDGLDSAPLFHSMATLPPPLQVVSKCSGTSSGTPTSNFPGGYEPAALAATAGYDYQPLLSKADAGQGNTLALVEFSNADPSPVQTYQNCYSLQVPITNVAVNGGATDSDGAAEVQLDEEIAAANAPGLDGIYDYTAANGTGFGTMVDQILANRATTGVDEISISWGACEAAMAPADVTAADTEFELAAAAGVSVFAASGDSGASGCQPSTGSMSPAVSFPASDPWVTSVGGTTLTTSASGANRETAWGQPATFSGGGGGGGVSSLFAMPAWQSGLGVDEPGYSSTTACGQTTLLCREVPDVALDANPDSGYVIRVTTPLGNVWTQAGGTSASAPLMAAITADVNTTSIAAGGQRLGFANPFLYAHPAVFRDITLGTNSIQGVDLPYPAGTGYDMATGLGSPDGSALASALIAATTNATDSTQLSGIESSTTLTPTRSVTLSGTLNDTTVPTTLMSSRPISISGTYTVAGQSHTVTTSTTTDAVGNWHTTITTTLVGARWTWHAAYTGETGYLGSTSPTQILLVKPTITTASNLPWNGTAYTARHPTTVTLSGISTPAMAGATLKVQTRVKGATKWATSTVTATVATNGAYSATITLAATVTEYIRFSYTGSQTGPWLSIRSPARLFVIS